MKLLEKAKSLPSSPGVYFMKDARNQILYVGKAKNLRNRVISYFRNSKGHSPKIKKLVQHLQDFDYLPTDTEFEAFMLECSMIKDLKPIYNRMMKNPQSFTYIHIATKKGHQDIKITDNPNERDLCFGPYTSRSIVEKAILGLKEFYKIMCGNPTKRGTACLNYSLGLCIGICLGGSAAVEYELIINKIIDLLKGTNKDVLKDMEQMMLEASERFDFENAGKYRDTMEAVQTLLYKEKVITFTEENHRILMLEPLTENTFKLFLIKRTEVLYSEKFTLETIEMLKSHFYTHFQMNQTLPARHVSKDELDHAQIIYSYLNKDGVKSVLLPNESLSPEKADSIFERLLNTSLLT
ncbi:UvrB/UvrC motif-containing protein [Neobacillus sp. D3-1R]|uniref:UvrB/UvrC motif-containing protein n=1 Tax=Neobacillus sp. D3-1R TaxID=3445778 RepID=UPI003FA0E8A8